MFFFEQTFQTVLNGIDAAGGPMGAITNIANAILLLCALFAVYEAYARGGDARMIGIAAAKFLILGLIVSNYSTIFRNVNGAFNQVAATISPNDWANNWMLQVNQYFNGLGNTNWFNLVVSSIVALVSVLVQLVAAVVFPIALLIFTILYCLYGAVLYTVGPMVLALYPAFGVFRLWVKAFLMYQLQCLWGRERSTSGYGRRTVSPLVVGRTPGRDTRRAKMRTLSMTFGIGECREVLFWLLLLGSWQFLASPGSKTGIIGAVGTAAFLVYAGANVDRLRGLGLDHAHWRSAARTNWVCAAVSGILAGIIVFAIGTVSGQNMRLGDNWQLIALQLTLGPVLEEVVFRGYLFAFLMWLSTRAPIGAGRNQLVVVSAAVLFALVHLAQPGVSWLHLTCISSTGTLYGWIRWRSGSTAPAAVSHAAYNLALYAISGAVLLSEKASR
jgi:membrane protease YdiL (CAAX protease family)